jgi:hypothetical protein
VNRSRAAKRGFCVLGRLTHHWVTNRRHQLPVD